MVEKHMNGIWNTQLEADYADMYNEQLPSNWLEIVDISPNVYVEPVLDNYILRYCQPGEVRMRLIFMLLKMWDLGNRVIIPFTLLLMCV